ncbi:MAG TPA: ABC transporter ATP-binding protein [Pseudonocardiaceae bacterium]|jgi:putative ABC transport system ATP-binding protein|nr:ABC transporter ATP-binding protein [Pseudonocardiaceae bacterium]
MTTPAGPTTNVMVQAQALYRFFRTGEQETLALQGVSLSVRAGELVAVVGPSGSGKSTLLSCLAGLDEPDGGTVWVAGRRVSHQPEHVRARSRARQVGLLFQSANLIEHLTVDRNVALVQHLAGRPRRADPATLLDSLGLGGRAGAYPSELSGGEAARAGLAVAVANDPPLLLADEPTGELDTVTEAEILALLRRATQRGMAVLVASHSPAVAAAAHRCIGLVDGRVTA